MGTFICYRNYYIISYHFPYWDDSACHIYCKYLSSTSLAKGRSFVPQGNHEGKRKRRTNGISIGKVNKKMKVSLSAFLSKYGNYSDILDIIWILMQIGTPYWLLIWFVFIGNSYSPENNIRSHTPSFLCFLSLIQKKSPVKPRSFYDTNYRHINPSLYNNKDAIWKKILEVNSIG